MPRSVQSLDLHLPPTSPIVVPDAENGFGGGPVDATELRTRPSSVTPSTTTIGFVKRKTSQILSALTPTQPLEPVQIPAELQALVDSYASSAVAAEIKAEMDTLSAGTAQSDGTAPELRDVEEESTLLRGRNRASYITQFTILSGRAFKNLYRDPALLASNYTSAIALACTFWFDFLRLKINQLIQFIQCYAHCSIIMSVMTSQDSKIGWGCSSSHWPFLDSLVYLG